MELELTLTELSLLAAFVLCSLAFFGLAGWLVSRRLRQRALVRSALGAASREDHAAAFRRLAAAERCWLPATLHPTAGNCQRSLEEYAEILAHLGAEAREVGAEVDPGPLQELAEKRIALINRALFRSVAKEEIQSLEESFQEERTRLQRACDEVLVRGV